MGSVRVYVLAQLCPTLCDPMYCIVYQASLSMGFPKQEYRNGLPFPLPGDLLHPGIVGRDQMAQVLLRPSFNLLPHFLLLFSIQVWGISQSLLIKLAPASIAALSHCLIWVSSTVVYLSV